MLGIDAVPRGRAMKRNELLTSVSPVALQYPVKKNIFTVEDVYIKVFPITPAEDIVSKVEYWVMDYGGTLLAVFECPEVMCEYLLRQGFIDHTLH